MRFGWMAFSIVLFSMPGYAKVSIRKDTVTAKLATVGCSYHDVLWDKTGYDKDGRPTSEFLALDICTGIAQGQKLELFEDQLYAPGGLKIVRIKGKLYFVRVLDLENADTDAGSADKQQEKAVTTAIVKK